MDNIYKIKLFHKDGITLYTYRIFPDKIYKSTCTKTTAKMEILNHDEMAKNIEETKELCQYCVLKNTNGSIEEFELE
jgi:hypothetical protein